MTLIEVNLDSRTAPQDRSCEAVVFIMMISRFGGAK